MSNSKATFVGHVKCFCLCACFEKKSFVAAVNTSEESVILEAW